MLMQAPNIGRLHDELHGSLHLSHKNFDLGDINRGIARGDGARDRNRTCDLRVTSALLYRLSYTGGGLNLAPVLKSGNFKACPGISQTKKCPAVFTAGHFHCAKAVG